MNITQFKTIINKLFPGNLMEEFNDDYGFNNTSNNIIKTIGYSTNLSIEVIEQAKTAQVDLILTHHDAWDFIYGLKDECIKRLKEYNISHFWIHGPLDYIEFGTCTSLMNKIGIDNIIRFSEYKNYSVPGIGEFNEAKSFEDLLKKMKIELNEPVRAWKNHKNKVKKVGVLTGAGHSTDHIKFAFDQGCDTYITGEVSLYTIQYAQFVGVNLLVGSHTFTEIFGVESLALEIMERNVDLTLIQLKEEHFELSN
ncbi:Nif3-like dinuclear metal center hexameric protein [Sutcliffiella horikoshii]|uniref:Nif3-like dinuclear metal center hexameric protein n=1 Tax=Sutcliffiella horikoshii TaxID=79883 RepID=UPI001F47BB4E|nr:Nif3-like dinuclear metal center hexameric protein [Sutcliffiella horikoshii]MCG1022901.1 Nif3-like dinuclear metal center hexameric protein [Sutcliffiella horikoshii]